MQGLRHVRCRVPVGRSDWLGDLEVEGLAGIVDIEAPGPEPTEREPSDPILPRRVRITGADVTIEDIAGQFEDVRRELERRPTLFIAGLQGNALTRVLFELRQAVPVPGDAAPRAVGGTLAGDWYSLPTTLVEIALREIGWREFTDTYVPVIAGFARNAGVPPREIDDVIQDALLNFFRAAKRFEYDPSRGRFRGYLKSITLNAIRSRHRRRRPATRENEDLEMPLDGERADALWDREWTEQLLHRAQRQRGRNHRNQQHICGHEHTLGQPRDAGRAVEPGAGSGPRGWR